MRHVLERTRAGALDAGATPRERLAAEWQVRPERALTGELWAPA
jgi:hypothetical protein